MAHSSKRKYGNEICAEEKKAERFVFESIVLKNGNRIQNSGLVFGDYISYKLTNLKDEQIENWNFFGQDRNTRSTLGKAYIQLCMK